MVDLAMNLPGETNGYNLQIGAGNYGVFNESRFRAEIVPKVVALMQANAGPMPKDLNPKLATPAASDVQAGVAESDETATLIASEALPRSGAPSELHA
jgi:hypothetical protein